MGWDSSDYYSFKAFGGDLDYYFIYGPDFYTMVDRYTELTGKSPMLPRFAMGLHVGTYSGGTWKNEEMIPINIRLLYVNVCVRKECLLICFG